MKNFKTLLISFLMLVSPLYTNAKNMETNFYYQTILDNVIPRNQNIGSETPEFCSRPYCRKLSIHDHRL